MTWHLLGSMSGRTEHVLKYGCDQYPGLMKEILTSIRNGHPTVRVETSYYWEASKEIYDMVDAALEARK